MNWEWEIATTEYVFVLVLLLAIKQRPTLLEPPPPTRHIETRQPIPDTLLRLHSSKWQPTLL